MNQRQEKKKTIELLCNQYRGIYSSSIWWGLGTNQIEFNVSFFVNEIFNFSRSSWNEISLDSNQFFWYPIEKNLVNIRIVWEPKVTNKKQHEIHSLFIDHRARRELLNEWKFFFNVFNNVRKTNIELLWIYVSLGILVLFGFFIQIWIG